MGKRTNYATAAFLWNLSGLGFRDIPSRIRVLVLYHCHLNHLQLNLLKLDQGSRPIYSDYYRRP